MWARLFGQFCGSKWSQLEPTCGCIQLVFEMGQRLKEAFIHMPHASCSSPLSLHLVRLSFLKGLLELFISRIHRVYALRGQDLRCEHVGRSCLQYTY